jgi:choline monooxygenase
MSLTPFDAAAWLQAQPLATALALPAHCYVEPSMHGRDRDAVFARSWQLVTHADRVQAPGDHAVTEIAGVPLVVVRGEDHVLRALHNVCRHRAGPLARCDGRAASALTCQYHGWTYALDGQLRGAPEMGRASGFDPAAIRLPQARVAEWQGLVFAALDERAPLFHDVVDGIDARLAAAGHRPRDYRFHHRISYDIACDWKVYVDNYLEGYHVPRVHPGLSALLDYRSYTTTPARWHSLQSSPLDSAPSLYGSGEALYYYVYPNTMLNCLPGRLQTNRVLPLATGRCRVEFDFFYAEADAARAAADAQFSDDVQQEDIGICEAVQRNLASGSYVAGRLNPLRESGVWHFHELLRAAYRTRADAGAA